MSNSERLFGTDGIRGVANEYPMTSEVALRIGRALACFFQRNPRHRRILVGKDTRVSGYMLETALASGITSMGADILLAGPMPTPAVAFLTQGMRAAAGVMISASHNPYPDNGIKIFDHQGFKLDSRTEERLESMIRSADFEKDRPSPEQIGKAFRVPEAQGRYVEYLKRAFPAEYSLEGLKLIVDCAHGATYQLAPRLFEELGADVVPLGIHPTGTNINDGCGALFPEKLAETVRAAGAFAGIALDGDGDRVVFVDEKGRVVPGDAVIAVMGEDLMCRGLLKQGTVVGTVMSNIGLEKFLAERGGRLVRTPVGDRYLIEEMRKNGYLLGGESSGHVIFGEHSTTGDGLLTALQVLAICLRRKSSHDGAQPLSELTAAYLPYPQVLKNLRVSKRVDLGLCPDVQRKIQEIEGRLKDCGRILVRYSGTEPLVRVMVEGEDSRTIESMADEVVTCVSQALS